MARAKVLAVDDKPSMTRLVQSWLGVAGIPCDTASSAQEALRLMQQNLYFVVVADIHMPGMSGVEMISALKEISPLVQVVMLTADASVEQVIACAERGAIDFLAKDGDYEQLVQSVRFTLERHERWAGWISPRAMRAVPAGDVV